MSLDNTYDGNASAGFGHQSFHTDITESSLSSAVFATTPENSFSSDEQHKPDHDGDSLAQDEEEEGGSDKDRVSFPVHSVESSVCLPKNKELIIGLPYPTLAELIETLIKCTQALLLALVRFPRFEIKLQTLHHKINDFTGNSSSISELSSAIRDASDLLDDILSSSAKCSEHALKLWRQEEEETVHHVETKTTHNITSVTAAARSSPSAAACCNKVIIENVTETGRSFSEVSSGPAIVQEKRASEWMNGSLKRIELQYISTSEQLAQQRIIVDKLYKTIMHT
jgi:ElaB/YqjD/DUF883 family membrane-anchored ribosome-binding protein